MFLSDINTRIDDHVGTANADVYDERAFVAGFQSSEFVLEVHGVTAFIYLVFSSIC